MRVLIAAPAREQAENIDRFWRDHRPESPNLFARELDRARRLLTATPEIGAPYVARDGVLVRRLLLRRTRNHVYYTVDRAAGIIMIIAVWGTPKRKPPSFE